MSTQREQGHVGDNMDPKTLWCTTPGYDCGHVTIPGGGSSINCGMCSKGEICVNNKCQGKFAAAIATQLAGVIQSGSTLTPRPLPGKYDVKAPLYEGQPYLRALLQTVYDQLASINSIPAEGKTQELIKAWMDEKGFTTIVEACKWAGYGPDLVGVDNYCKDVGKLSLSPVTQAMCDKRKKELLDKVADNCASTYTHDYLTTVEALKQQELERIRQEQEAGEQVPVAEKSNALLWVLGIGAVIAAGGAAVYFSQKPASSNPSDRTSGYKKLDSALVQALKIAKKEREERYVVPRSDGFKIVRYRDLTNEDANGENWVVVPKNQYRHWFHNKIIDSGPVE